MLVSSMPGAGNQQFLSASWPSPDTENIRFAASHSKHIGYSFTDFIFSSSLFGMPIALLGIGLITNGFEYKSERR
jgi:hypothetical protein